MSMTYWNRRSNGINKAMVTLIPLSLVPSRIEVARMTTAVVDLFCRSFPAPPAAVTLDIDDTCDAVHDRQQLSVFHITTTRAGSSPFTSIM